MATEPPTLAYIHGVRTTILRTGAKITADGSITIRAPDTGAVMRFEPLNLPPPKRSLTPGYSDAVLEPGTYTLAGSSVVEVQVIAERIPEGPPVWLGGDVDGLRPVSLYHSLGSRRMVRCANLTPKAEIEIKPEMIDAAWRP